MAKLKEYLLEEKLFIYTLFAIILISILSIIANIVIGFHFSINYKWIGAIVYSLFALKLSFNRKYLIPLRFITSSLLIFFFLPIGFITSGGSFIVICYLLLISLKTNYLFYGKLRLFFNGAIMFVFFGLFYIKHTYPGLFPQYSDSQHIMDMLFQVPIVLFLFALMLSVFADAYRNEREKLKEYSKLLYEKNKELEKLSTTDELTGLYNRRYIFGKLEQLGKEKVNSLIILIDLDNFKQINDKYGHDAGDKVIVKFSEVIKDAIGDQGIVARYGGDEFLIVLDDVQLAEGKQMAEKILKTINELKFNNEVSITVSGGVAFYNGDKGIKEVVKNADQLLYNAKGNGKNDIIIGS